MALSKEEIQNLISLRVMESERKHNIEGCEYVRRIQTYVNGDLQSDLERFKGMEGKQKEIDKELRILNDSDVGKVTILWKERDAVIKTLVGVAVSIVTALVIFWVTQNSYLVKTEQKLDYANKYQYAQVLLLKYSITKEPGVKVEADKILKELLEKQ